MTLPRTILVATDFSEPADHALDYVVDMARQLDATVHLVPAISIPPMGLPEIGEAYSAVTIESITESAQAEVDKRVAKYRGRAKLAETRLEIGDPREMIDRVAEEIGADLIVMGTHGRRGI